MNTAIKRINFHYLVSSFFFPNRNTLKKYIIKVFQTEGFKVNKIDYIFCDDQFLLCLNLKYLKHNSLTDIITFPLNNDNQGVMAEIYISIDRIRENTKNFKTSLKFELHRVIFHGALHLCGYNDKNKEQQKEMRKKEQFYLNNFFISRGTKN